MPQRSTDRQERTAVHPVRRYGEAYWKQRGHQRRILDELPLTGSIEVSRTVRDDGKERITRVAASSVRFVLHKIDDHLRSPLGRQGQSLSVATLARRTSYSTDVVHRAFRALARLGLIDPDGYNDPRFGRSYRCVIYWKAAAQLTDGWTEAATQSARELTQDERSETHAEPVAAQHAETDAHNESDSAHDEQCTSLTRYLPANNPPPPPAADVAGWEVVAEELFSLGVNYGRPALAKARERGATPAGIGEGIEHFREHAPRQAWTPAALQAWISAWEPGTRREENWPVAPRSKAAIREQGNASAFASFLQRHQDQEAQDARQLEQFLQQVDRMRRDDLDAIAADALGATSILMRQYEIAGHKAIGDVRTAFAEYLRDTEHVAAIQQMEAD